LELQGRVTTAALAAAGRVDDPGLAEAGDPLYRDIGKLTGTDREIARDFLAMLAERSQKKKVP
jgi:hypothetical protein